MASSLHTGHVSEFDLSAALGTRYKFETDLIAPRKAGVDRSGLYTVWGKGPPGWRHLGLESEK